MEKTIQKYISKVIDGKPMFGKDFKYILALTFLIGMTYSMPQVRAAIANQEGDNPAMQSAASFLSIFGFGNSNTSSTISPGVPQQPIPQNAQVVQQSSIQGAMPMPRPIPPQDVVTALYDAGIISADKLDQARQIAAGLAEQNNCPPGRNFGTTTPVGTTTPPFGGNGMASSTAPCHIPIDPVQGTGSTTMSQPPMSPMMNVSNQTQSMMNGQDMNARPAMNPQGMNNGMANPSQN